MILNTVRLGDIATVTSSKRIFAHQYTPTGIPFYRQKEIIDKKNKLDITDPLFISEDTYYQIKNKFGVPQKGDLLITAVGVTLGIPYVVADEVFYFKDGNLIWLKDFDNDVNSKYIYYWITSDLGQKSMWSRIIGAAQPALTIDAIKQFEIQLPNIDIQNKIAEILSAYDDLIENNQKQIKLLEEAAQRLYTEWFVDLRFPGYENTPITDGVPQGWKVIEIGTAFKTLLGGTPSREKAEYWENGTVPWINSGKVNELRVVEPSEYITDIALDRSATKLLPKHTTLVAITGATLGQVSYTEIETCANQSVVGIVDESQRYSEYVYCYVLDNIKNIIGKATGGAQQHINKDIVNSYPIILPNDDIAVKFQSAAKPIFDKISKLLFENINLTEARDRLLPKLMSGELEV